jgi:hypothetical protein
MTNIYELHDKAFARVSAFVICRNGEKVATVALKFPADGAGRLYAYVHWLGLEMVRGHAGGYGYDKRSAAVADAINRIGSWQKAYGPENACPEAGRYDEFHMARHGMDSRDWTCCLEDAGFAVLQAC